MDERASFGLWLRERRKALRLTQEDLAERMSCSCAMVRKIEAGQRAASGQMAELLAEAFGIVPTEHPAFIQFAQGRLHAVAAERPRGEFAKVHGLGAETGGALSF